MINQINFYIFTENDLKKKISACFIIWIIIGISGCSNSCSNAKADVVKFTTQYMNGLYQGKLGASVPGGAESIEALEMARKVCNKPNLTVQEILLENTK
jgi:hypothetical protein